MPQDQEDGTTKIILPFSQHQSPGHPGFLFVGGWVDLVMKKFIAMNRFKIAIGRESDFEGIWKNRETYLDDVDGFQKFNLLKGSTNDVYTLYTSHSTWDSKSDFENWKRSEAFRKAHSGGGEHQGIYLGHPEFEGFEVIL